VIANVTENLKVGWIERQLRMMLPRLNVIDVDHCDPINRRRTATLTSGAARLDDFHAESTPFV